MTGLIVEASPKALQPSNLNVDVRVVDLVVFTSPDNSEAPVHSEVPERFSETYHGLGIIALVCIYAIWKRADRPI